MTIKYDQNGSRIWTATYNGSANVDDEGYGIIIDGLGNICVTGYVRGLGILL